MFINDKMKVNKFKVVAIPRNRDYFGRLGNSAASPNMFSGDEVLSTGSKIDDLALMDQYDRYMQKVESEKTE